MDDLIGKSYKGRHPKPADWYDGRIITVISVDPLVEGNVLVQDSTGRRWGTDAQGVREELERQNVR